MPTGQAVSTFRLALENPRLLCCGVLTRLYSNPPFIRPDLTPPLNMIQNTQESSKVCLFSISCTLPNPQAKGLEPTVFTFRYALAACSGSSRLYGRSGAEDDVAAGSWERCRSVMDAMGRAGVQPDRLCYKYAVDAAAKVRKTTLFVPFWG